MHLFLTKGFITDKEALPVTELHFGRNQLSGSSGRYTLGKLECSGRSTFNEIPTGCRDLYEIGHVLNGFYPVKNGNKIDMIYCDFSSFAEGIYISDLSTVLISLCHYNNNSDKTGNTNLKL